MDSTLSTVLITRRYSDGTEKQTEYTFEQYIKNFISKSLYYSAQFLIELAKSYKTGSVLPDENLWGICSSIARQNDVTPTVVQMYITDFFKLTMYEVSSHLYSFMTQNCPDFALLLPLELNVLATVESLNFRDDKEEYMASVILTLMDIREEAKLYE